MALTLDTELRERVPLAMDARGAIRVGGTRVPLEIVVEAFRQGDSAEEIAAAYPAVALDDVYAVLTYYLRHREDVDRYVAERRAIATELKASIQAEQHTTGLRERLLARRVSR